MPQTLVRQLTSGEIDEVVDWAALEGWNPGLGDAAAFRAYDPGGFLGVFADGRLASAISAVRYEESFGFIGFYICRPEQRGQGLGKLVWDAGLARLAGRTIGLDGVVAQQANYARAGFALAHRNIRFSGMAPALSTPGSRLLEIGPDAPASLIDAVVRYDGRHFPAPREDFARIWMEPPHRRAVACLSDGAICGYGVIRACRSGAKIGPLFAQGEDVAEALFCALAALHAGAPVMLDLPAANPAARRLAERHGLAPVFETARMYRGAPPDLPLDRIFGVTTFELG